MKGAFWTSCAHHLGRVCATTCINFEDWDGEKKSLQVHFNQVKQRKYADSPHKAFLVNLDVNLYQLGSAFCSATWRLPTEEEEKTVSLLGSLADSVVTLFQFEYLWNLLGMCWNFTHCKAELINYERLAVFLQRRGQQARYRTFFITPICACHTYFKSLMHHHCREKVCA